MRAPLPAAHLELTPGNEERLGADLPFADDLLVSPDQHDVEDADHRAQLRRFEGGEHGLRQDLHRCQVGVVEQLLREGGCLAGLLDERVAAGRQPLKLGRPIAQVGRRRPLRHQVARALREDPDDALHVLVALATVFLELAARRYRERQLARARRGGNSVA